MIGYIWKPIEPLSDRDRSIDLADMPSLYDVLRASKARLEKSRPAGLKDFTQRLIRRLCVETGILERLYDLDRGTTETLVLAGFVEELVARSSTDVEPSHLIDMLKDHEAAIRLVMDSIAGSRALSKGFIHDLQSILTLHQDTTTAIDQFDKKRKIPLLKGKFKVHPNNPRRYDGTLHEYCPPIHVDTEIEQLISWFSEYEMEDPIIVAAWFHHRFTQIHPYQDGNGRTARALTTMALLRADLLPIVIDRDLKGEYITSLEFADAGDLSRIAFMFARLERDAILQALSIDVDTEKSDQRTLTSAVLESLTEKIEKRRKAINTELRHVNEVALGLRSRSLLILKATYEQIRISVFGIADPVIDISEGGTDSGNAHFYKFEVGKFASESGKFANFFENHYFVKASIRVKGERLIFVTSFHHIGRELYGIMEVTAFAQLESFEDSEDRKSMSQDFFLCSSDPFVFTYTSIEDSITESFSLWLDAALAVAVKEYSDRL